MEKEKTTLSVAQGMALGFATCLSHFEIYFLFYSAVIEAGSSDFETMRREEKRR